MWRLFSQHRQGNFVLYIIALICFLIAFLLLLRPDSDPIKTSTSSRTYTTKVLVENNSPLQTQVAAQVKADIVAWEAALREAPARATSTAIYITQARVTAKVGATRQAVALSQAWATRQVSLPVVTFSAAEATTLARSEERALNEVIGAGRLLDQIMREAATPRSEQTAIIIRGNLITAQARATAASNLLANVQANPVRIVVRAVESATAVAVSAAVSSDAISAAIGTPPPYLAPTQAPTPPIPTPAPLWIAEMEGPESLQVSQSDAITLTLTHLSAMPASSPEAERSLTVATIGPLPEMAITKTQDLETAGYNRLGHVVLVTDTFKMSQKASSINRSPLPGSHGTGQYKQWKQALDPLVELCIVCGLPL